MKIKGIVFFGFAAAILSGTANAAVTPMKIASQAYVDGRIESISGNLAGSNESLTGFESGTTVVGAVNDLKSDVDVLNGNAQTSGSVAHAEASASSAASAAADAQSDVDALEAVVGNLTAQEGGLSGFASGTDTVVEALNELNSGKVNVSDKATTIRTIANASDDKWATELAVATIVDGLTGGGGTVSQQIADKLGTAFTGDNAYATVTAALADKADSSTVTALDTRVGSLETTVNTATTGLTDKVAALESTVNTANTGLTAKVAALEGTVNTATTGLTDRVGALETTVNTATTGLSDKVTALETKATGYDALKAILEGYATCIAAIEQSAGQQGGHCVLSASTSGQIEWAPVTFPWVEE